MSEFTEFTAFSRIEGTDTFVLDASLRWDIGRKGSEWKMVIPKGTLFDISVPWIFRWFLRPDDRQVLPCAALHDELLVQDYDRPFASAEFRRAAIARGSPSWRGWILFLATLLWTVATQRSAEKVMEKRSSDEARLPVGARSAEKS